MKRIAPAAAAVLVLSGPLSALAQTPAPDLDAQTRCAALFAMVAADQNRKVPGTDRFPPLASKGRDFFVATGLRLMDERKMPQQQLELHFRALIAKMQDDFAAVPDRKARVDSEMAVCLPMLDQVPIPPEAK